MPKTTHRNTWKQRERSAAAIFGTRRQRCSGSSGIEGQTRSDSVHPRLFLEHKLRAAHAVLTLWRDTKVLAHKEGKDPVVILSEKGKHGQWLLVHEADMPSIVANWLAAQDIGVNVDVMHKVNEYIKADFKED